MSDISKAVDSLPGWAIPATIGAVVLLALLQTKGPGSSGGTVGNVTAYGPVPSDPGLVGLASSEVAARQSVYTTALNVFGSEEISRISAGRDVAISGINASVANQRTAASEAVGLAQTDAQTKIGLANATTAADINRTNVAGATSQAHIAAKTATGKSIIDGIVGIGKSVLHIFGG